MKREASQEVTRSVNEFSQEEKQGRHRADARKWSIPKGQAPEKVLVMGEWRMVAARRTDQQEKAHSLQDFG